MGEPPLPFNFNQNTNYDSYLSMMTSENPVYQKITWRLLPVLFLCYILAYLDRVNVGFAKLAMKEELWFSDAVFALGSGIFFIGYFLFEVPANLIMHRVGARVWITRIMITWGLCSALCAMSTDAVHFYFFRFLLGMAEAGFFPGVILYLTYWYPEHYRARMVASFMSAVALAGIIGSPVSGWLLESSQSWNSLKPWQWLFLLEGFPSVLFGLLVPLLLADGPAKVKWLSAGEKQTVADDLKAAEELRSSTGLKAGTLRDAFRSPWLWLCCLVYLSFIFSLYGISFWLPQLLEEKISKDKLIIGLVAAVPWLCASVGMILFGRHSDRTGERRWHISIMAWAGMAAFLIAGIPAIPGWIFIAMISLAATASLSSISTFWSLPSAILSGTAAAAGIAWINSVGNLAGYLSPELFLWMKEHFHLGAGLMAVGVLLGLGGLLTFLLWPARRSVSR